MAQANDLPLRIHVLTLFPEMFAGILGESMLKRAVDNHLLEVHLVNFRDYATDRHRTVDDYPFGGGAGMVLKPQPVFRAMESLPGRETGRREVVLLTPQGRPFSQDMAKSWATMDEIVLICGHYEGFDERIRMALPTCEVSLGDFVLTGGEIPAMAIIDAVTRLIPGVLGNCESASHDSFAQGLLEHPQYTRPAEYRGMSVPDVLLSGNHAEIEKWRHDQSLYRTWKRRPELLPGLNLSEEDKRRIEAWEHQLDVNGTCGEE